MPVHKKIAEIAKKAARKIDPLKKLREALKPKKKKKKTVSRRVRTPRKSTRTASRRRPRR